MKNKILELFNDRVVTIFQPNGHRWLGKLVRPYEPPADWFIKYGDVNVHLDIANIRSLTISAHDKLHITVIKEI